MLPEPSVITNWFQKVLENAPDAIMALRAVRDSNGTIEDLEYLFTNKKAVESVGRTDLTGKYFSKEFPESKITGLFNIYVRVIETGEAWQGDIKFKGEGFDFWAHVSASKMGDGCIVSYLDVTEKKKTDMALLENRTLLQKIIDAPNIGLAVYKAVRNNKGKIIDFIHEYINKTTIAALGSDFTGRLLSEHGENAISQIPKLIEAIESGKTNSYLKQANFGGSEHWISFYNSPIGNDKLVHSWEDVTERKNAEHELLRLKEQATRTATDKYLTLFNSIDEGFCIIEVLFDKKGKAYDYRFLEANHSFAKQTGLSDVIGKTMKELAPDHEQYWFDIYGQIAMTGSPARFENAANALGHYYEVYAFQVDEPQQHHVAILFNDISTRKRSEEALRKSEEAFRSFATASSDIVYKMSAYWKHMEFLEGKDFLVSTADPDATWIDSYIPPHEKQRVARAIEDAIRGKKIFELEHQVFNNKGELAWTYSRAVPILDDEGNIVEWIGAASDITQRRQSEKRILISEGKYHTLFNSMDEGVVVYELIFDEAGKAVDFVYLEHNPALKEQTGITIDLVGKKMTEIFPDLEPYWLETYERIAKTGTPERHEYYFITLDIWFDVYISRVGDESSHTLVNIYNNITERKKAEERQIFLLQLSDAIHDLSSAQEIKETACRLLAEKLSATRVLYAENFIHREVEYFQLCAQFSTGTDFPPVPIPAEKYRAGAAPLYKGNIAVTNDVMAEIPVEEQINYSEFNIQAFIAVPLLKNGKSLLVLIVHDNKPRKWTKDEISLVEETAERTWMAVERSKTGTQLKDLNESLEKLVEERTAELKQNQHILERQSNYLNRVTDTMPDMISVTELETKKVEYINKTTFKLQGYDPDIILSDGESILRKLSVHPDDHELVEDYYSRFEFMEDDEVWSVDYRAKTHISDDWSWYRIRGRVFLRDEAGKPTHNLNVIQDISFEKQAIERIKDLNNILVLKNRELAYVNSELKTFNTIAATDYEESLKQVYVNLELIISNEAKRLSDSGRANLRRAQSAIQKLKLLTDDLNNYTKLKEPDTELKTVDLNGILDEAIADFGIWKDDFEIKWNCEKLPPVTGYPFLLSLVFHHLLENAIKFKKGDKAHITIDCEESVENFHIISISDKGIGFPHEKSEDIFNIFVRLNEKSKYRGSGTGLAICKKIMELHGGFITAEGQPGEGATFNCYFPE